jgi:hypothetical protein
MRYSINREAKEIELLSGGTVEELGDVIKLFEGFTFKIGKVVLNSNPSGMVVGAIYTPIIKKLDYN